MKVQVGSFSGRRSSSAPTTPLFDDPHDSGRAPRPQDGVRDRTRPY